MTVGNPKELNVKESTNLPSICPRKKFYPTSVSIIEGAKYRITAHGKWKDSGMRGLWRERVASCE